MLTSTGTGAMEAAAVNLLSPGDEVLVVVSGKFGERWSEMLKKFGAQVIALEVPWGEAVSIETLRITLTQHPKVKAVFSQAVETSTATVHPIKELARTVKEHSPALVVIDAITGLGAMELPMDEWGIDVLITGSQKALMLPTGLSFVALSKQAWECAKTAKMPRFYFDLWQERKANEKGQTYFSSANSHIVALDVALAQFQKVGLPSLIDRSRRLAEGTRAAGQILGFSTYSKCPAQSVTALQAPAKVNSTALRDHLEKRYNITVMGGQDQLSGKILRIGHLGYIQNQDMMALVQGLTSSLRDLGQDLPADIESKALAKMKSSLEH